MKPHIAWKQLFWLFAFLLVLSLFTTACRSQPQTLKLATTTSTYDSGLLDYLLPIFEEKYNAQVEVIAVGTGQALALGQTGEVDVVLVHARPLEEQFVAEGYGINRQDVMYNDFVLVGPPADPAGVADVNDVVAAFGRIAASEATFVSRGDNSGTHVKEMSIWEQVGIHPEGSWYLSVGQGMGATLTMADEKQAYTLADRGTYLKRQAEGLGLVILFEGDPLLHNPYGVIMVNPSRFPHVNGELADKFVMWLTSPEAQMAIDRYRVDGQQLFFSNLFAASEGK
ncbi:MAG: tungsten ABC transporter substrate-binding protein [Chloroflexi bacterium]|nr:MAG: tungsten ABC transporter substrate-binding protein [Chloroflexota bacterium]